MTLTHQQALELVKTRNRALKNNGRIEIGNGMIKDLIEAFCDSPYISKDNYTNTLEELMEIFYTFKNETEEKISDKELILMMKTYFNNSCEGSTELLANRELENFVRQMRGIADEKNEDELEIDEDV